MKILVTGAAGHLGGRLSEHLAGLGHQVTGLDLTAREAGSVPVHAADLSRLDPGWMQHLAGQEAVVHLAANRWPDAPWDAVVQHNMDAVLNLFHAAQKAGVSRVVFASSNWVLGGYRFGSGPLSGATVPMPVNAYGMAKLMGERIGAHYAAAHGMTVIGARVGWVQWTHDNQPGPHMAMGRWGQLMWLSNRDYLAGMTAAATAPASGFHVVNLMSNNPGMRWSLEAGRDVLGFMPQDGAPAQLPLRVRLGEARDWLRSVGLPRLIARALGKGW